MFDLFSLKEERKENIQVLLRLGTLNNVYIIEKKKTNMELRTQGTTVECAMLRRLILVVISAEARGVMRVAECSATGEKCDIRHEVGVL